MTKSLAVFVVIIVSIFLGLLVRYLHVITCINFLYLTVAAQEGPGIVIVHPGQNVTLLCTLGIPLSTQHTTEWIINHTPLGVQSIINGILPGYSADVNNNNLIVQNIVMNDRRNDTEYQCVIIRLDTRAILNESDLTFLYVAGKYRYVHCRSGCIKYSILYKWDQRFLTCLIMQADG